MGHDFTWASLIPGLSRLPVHVSNAILISIVLIVIMILGYRQLRKTASEIVPDEKLTFRNFLEIIVEAVVGLVDSTMGPRGKEFILIIGILEIWSETTIHCNIGRGQEFSPALRRTGDITSFVRQPQRQHPGITRHREHCRYTKSIK